jgi:glycosyltransferase involved in cell wall biosynthesis
VPSLALERIARTAYELRAPIIRIPNGVDVRKFKPANGTELRARLGLSPADFVIGCVAHLRAEKGHLRLLRAVQAAAIPNGVLILLGDGPMRPLLEKTTAELGLQRRVLFLGSLESVADYYAAMDVFALASDTEQMPMSLLEAMACGLPAVCTDVGDCREMLGPQLRPTVFAVGDIAGFSNALGAFSADKVLRSTTGQMNRDRAVKEYDSELMFERYRELYLRTIRAGAKQNTASGSR